MSEQVGGIYYDVTLDTRKLVDGTRVVDRELSSVAGKFNIVAAAVAALGAAMAAARIAQRADEFRLLATRVEVAAGSVQSGVVAFESLVAISRRTQSSLAGNIEVFNRLNQSLLQMGGTQNDTLLVTELLAKAIKVSGASAVEAKAAMLQFGQALGSGKLAGDELRSLMETAPYLMRQLADGIGVPVGALKKLGEDGKLTADVVVNALTKAAARIDEDFKKFPQTIEAAMVVAADAAGLAAKQLDDLTGTSSALTGVVKGTGEVVEKLAEQFAEANRQAGGFNRNDAVRTWADATRNALSYLADAVDASKQVFDAYFVYLQYGFRSVGNWIAAATSQAAALARGDVAGALEINASLLEQQKKLAAQFEANKAAVSQRSGKMLSGEKMRAGWAMGDLGQSDPTELARRGRGPGASRLKPPAPDNDELRKLAAKTAAAQAYYQGLVADNASAMGKIDAEEQKALADNKRRSSEDKNNQAIYAAARVEIVKKYSRERALLEEKTAQEVGDLLIAMTTDQEAKIEAVRVESFRRAEAAEKLGVITHDQAERQKAMATITASQQRAAIAERVAQTTAESQIAATTDELTRIDLLRQESLRRTEAAYRQGAISFAQAEADKARAAVDAQNAIRQQVLSVNPLAQLQRDYEQKLSIVRFYEQQMAQAGVDGAAFVEAKRTELARQYQQQRLALAEAEFAWQSEGNKFLIDSINSLSTTATQSITGLLTGTMSATDAVRGLAGVVLNEAVSALVQMGAQYVKNALIGQAADKALLASKAANAAIYTAAVTAQVGVNTALAAQAAFASTAAIPIVGPALAPAAAAAAAAAAGAIGAPAAALAPVAGNRQYGGPVSAGNLYRVNEAGQPEMFTAANGSQYLMPTRSGKVIPADQVGGASKAPTVIIQNMGAPVSVQSQSWDQQNNTMRLTISELSRQVRENEGQFFSALQSHTNVRGAL